MVCFMVYFIHILINSVMIVDISRTTYAIKWALFPLMWVPNTFWGLRCLAWQDKLEYHDLIFYIAPYMPYDFTLHNSGDACIPVSIGKPMGLFIGWSPYLGIVFFFFFLNPYVPSSITIPLQMRHTRSWPLRHWKNLIGVWTNWRPCRHVTQSARWPPIRYHLSVNVQQYILFWGFF